jgi:hypothetical protein
MGVDPVAMSHRLLVLLSITRQLQGLHTDCIERKAYKARGGENEDLWLQGHWNEL